MSLHLEFEPHSWYMGWAIKREHIIADPDSRQHVWLAYTANGMTGYIVERQADTLRDLKKQIKQYDEAERARVERLYNGQ